MFEFFEIGGGVDEEIPDKKPFEFFFVGLVGVGGFESGVKIFESRENVEVFFVPFLAVEDGIGGFVVMIERLIDVGEMIGIEYKDGHQSHVFVDDAFGKFKIVLPPPIGFDDNLPGAHAVADEAGFVVWFGFVDRGEIADFVTIFV